VVRRPFLNLLDTHVLLWSVHDPEKLSDTARRIVEEGDLAVSAVSLWEMLVKKGHPKNEIVPDPLAWWNKHVVGPGARILDIEWRHVQQLDGLPLFHKDPFDRILICQCRGSGLRLVTRDGVIRKYYQELIHCVW
jgi:PIN domain nuclease of toxin-antitoxin system